MLSCIIFDSNKVSELIIKNFLKNANIEMCISFCEKLEVKQLLKTIDANEPNLIIIEYELYCNCIYDIISSIRRKLPSTVVYVVSNEIKRKEMKKLITFGVNDIFIKPFIDAHFVMAINMLTNN